MHEHYEQLVDILKSAKTGNFEEPYIKTKVTPQDIRFCEALLNSCLLTDGKDKFERRHASTANWIRAMFKEKDWPTKLQYIICQSRSSATN